MKSQLESFLADWTEDENGIKPLFLSIYSFLRGLDTVSLDYKGRPGVSHSLRAKHVAQTSRPIFVLVDVIDDDPEARWLSVCFYADFVSNPDNRGDIVPGGLMGEDACCFDIEEPNNVEKFILARLKEAHANAAKNL